MHVLRDVRTVLATNPNLDGWFPVAHCQDSYGRRQMSFDMTRDGFTLLAMGYTGAKAMAFKVR